MAFVPLGFLASVSMASSVGKISSALRRQFVEPPYRGRQQVVLAPDGFFVGHECDYGAFHGLRLSLAVGGPDILSADCSALGLG
jgi:hypothetical protein